MKLNPIASNMMEVETEKGLVLFSYKTPVAVHIPGEGAYHTETKWSMTTTRHINKWLDHHGISSKGTRPQSFFDGLI